LLFFFYLKSLVSFPLTASAFTALSLHGSCNVRVIGNLAIVAKPIGNAGTEDVPLQSAVGDFWCGIEKVGEEVPVEYGEFTRLRDGKIFEATISDRRAKLHFGTAPATVAGKYMCEVRGSDGELLRGYLFLYSPPILQLPSRSIFYEVLLSRPPKVVGEARTAREGDRVELRCPVFGYPQPHAMWQKNGTDIEVSYIADNLILSKVSRRANGVYTCIADNSFPMFVDGPSMPHQLIYEQKLNVLP
uniref:Ig-like domain-containing protein n=1 Tax=Angiostrongylus costaricensis TaxID=334426 RepID=A0A0R3PFW8_ANGCS